MTSPLPEIREADASPEIRAIYADIAQAQGVAQVNLIWRHLATEPAVLAWCWEALAPVYRSAELPAAALALFDGIAGEPTAPVWSSLDETASATAQTLLAYYNFANPQNLLALKALGIWARDGGSDDAPALTPRSGTNGSAADLPPLPKRTELAPDVATIIDDLASRHGGAALGVTPSMYLHLAQAPGAPEAAHARLTREIGTPVFAAQTRLLITRAEDQARRLAAAMSSTREPPPTAVRQPMLATVAHFVANTIPEMIVVGAKLSGRA